MTHFKNYLDRFFFIFGKTADEFCNNRLEILNLNFTLFNHLKNIGYDKIIFYRGGNRGFYCLDKNSYNLAFGVKKSVEKKRKSKINLSSRGPLGKSLKTKKIVKDNNIDTNERLTNKINDIDMNSYVRRFMNDNDDKTVIIFENFFDFLSETQRDILRDIKQDFNTFQTLSGNNQNIIIFIISQELKIEDIDNIGKQNYWTFLTNNLKKNSITLSTPLKDEIRNLLNYYRISKNIDVDWLQFDEIIDDILKFSKERNLSLKELNTKLFNLRKIDKKNIYEKLNLKSEKKGLEKLKELKGLDYLLKEIEKLVKFAKSKQIKSSEKNSEIARLIPQNKKNRLDVNLHISLVGNPGTGKTTVAKIISEIFKDEGILEVGHIVKVTRNDLVAGYVGQTAIKTQEKINQAIGGVLFIDEAYTLSTGGENDFGKEAIDTILEVMTDRMGEFAIIVAGYPNDMEKFLESNAGLKRRFANQILLKDYEPKVLENIFRNKTKKEGFNLDNELNNILPHFIENWFNARDERTFGNAGDILNIFDEMAKSAIFDERKILTQSDIPIKFNQYLKQQSNNTMAEALAKLDNIIGLESVKDNIKRVIASIKMEKLRGENKKVIAGHYIFKGNPGTGKTTVARILGEILKELKVLKKGHFVEVTKEDLVQGYVGQTAIKTKEILNKSLGGILFIDEAYSLSKGGENDFGKEAIDTIVPFMENNLADFTLIVAGYNDDMDKFLDANTGLKSRFTNTIIFEDYSNIEMLEIFKIFTKDYKLADGVETKLIEIFENLRVNSNHFGNGRDARKIFGAIKSNLDMRLLEIENLIQGDKRLNIIELEDVKSL